MNLYRLLNPKEIGILDMSTIFSQMDGDRTSSGSFRRQRRFYRIRISRQTRLSESRNVINVNAKFNHRLDSTIGFPGSWAATDTAALL